MYVLRIFNASNYYHDFSAIIFCFCFVHCIVLFHVFFGNGNRASRDYELRTNYQMLIGFFCLLRQ